ncbi:MAG: tetratricopeptide repeat protein [Desulfovibrionaceae bacterium]
MKAHILLALLLPAAALFTGCASTGSAVKAPTHYNEPGVPTTEYPDRGARASELYNYARGQWDAGEYREAAVFFEKSAASGTETGEWEFECLLNATVCWLEAGDPDQAKAALARANEVAAHAPPSRRARYLNALLLGGDRGRLAPDLRATLPRAI